MSTANLDYNILCPMSYVLCPVKGFKPDNFNFYLEHIYLLYKINILYNFMIK